MALKFKLPEKAIKRLAGKTRGDDFGPDDLPPVLDVESPFNDVSGAFLRRWTTPLTDDEVRQHFPESVLDLDD